MHTRRCSLRKITATYTSQLLHFVTVILLSMSLSSSRKITAAAFASKTRNALLQHSSVKTRLTPVQVSLLHRGTKSNNFANNYNINKNSPCTLYQSFSSSRSNSSSAHSNSNNSNNNKVDNWKVPKYVRIPEDKINFSFVRSSGAGGQNVNKVNTKAELRVHIMSAHWIPFEVRERIMQQQSNKINKDGTLVLQVQESRTQKANRELAVKKLSEIVLQAYPRPKERKLRTGISKASKLRNKEDKRRRSEVKQNRRRVDFY